MAEDSFQQSHGTKLRVHGPLKRRNTVSFQFRILEGDAMSKGKVGFPGGAEVKEPTCNAGDLGSIPGSGRPPGEGNGNPLQYPCLENPMVKGA